MYNLVHMFIKLLKELEFITEDAANALSRELSTKILPSNPEDAGVMVADAVKSVEEKLKGDLVKVEPWLRHISLLEARVKALEDKGAKKLTPKSK